MNLFCTADSYYLEQLLQVASGVNFFLWKFYNLCQGWARISPTGRKNIGLRNQRCGWP